VRSRLLNLLQSGDRAIDLFEPPIQLVERRSGISHVILRELNDPGQDRACQRKQDKERRVDLRRRLDSFDLHALWIARAEPHPKR
jgi:hypothetical protein